LVDFVALSPMVSAVELGKAAVERSGVKPEDVKELLVGNILSGALAPNAARQIGIGERLRRRRNGNRNGP
jgi:acetyl-CoA C-acetyltransferase